MQEYDYSYAPTPQPHHLVNRRRHPRNQHWGVPRYQSHNLDFADHRSVGSRCDYPSGRQLECRAIRLPG